MHYEKLFEKGTIGRLELRNRVVMTAMGTMLGDWNGCSTPEQVRFYEERAKGGCGLIIPEFTSVDPDSGHCNRIQLGIWDERQIASFERICDAVHRHGAKIFVQLHHGGLLPLYPYALSYKGTYTPCRGSYEFLAISFFIL